MPRFIDECLCSAQNSGNRKKCSDRNIQVCLCFTDIRIDFQHEQHLWRTILYIQFINHKKRQSQRCHCGNANSKGICNITRTESRISKGNVDCKLWRKRQTKSRTGIHDRGNDSIHIGVYARNILLLHRRGTGFDRSG